MAVSKIPSSFGEKTPQTRWTYNPVPCKSQHRGFLAGRPFGVFVHYEKMRSQPCCQAMTDKEVWCEHCDAGKVPDWRGYVPYYDAEYTPNFCLITYPYYEAVCEISHLEQIVIRRGQKKTDAVVIKGEAWRTTPIPPAKCRAEPADLSWFLIHKLFKCDALIEWDNRQQKAAAQEVCKPYVAPPEPVYQDKGLNRLKALLEREKKEQDRIDTAGDLAGQIIRNATTPKPNGKHTKPIA